MKKKLGLVLLGLFLSSAILAEEEKKDKLTFKSADGKNSVTLDAEFQGYGEFLITPSGNDKYNGLKFDIRRTGIKLSGSVIDPKLTYQFKISPKVGGTTLNRAFLSYEFHKHVSVTAGRYLSMFSREDMAIFALPTQSDAGRNFNDSIDKGTGIMFHNDENARFAWSVGIADHGLMGRIGYNHGDVDGYKYTDKKGGDLRWGVGLGLYTGTDYKKDIARDSRFTLDFIAKHNHLTADAAIYWKVERPEVGDVEHRWGGQVGLGYLINQKWEPAIRYSLYRESENNVGHEVMAAVGRYLFEDHVKVQGYGKLDLANAKVKNVNFGVDLFFKI